MRGGSLWLACTIGLSAMVIVVATAAATSSDPVIRIEASDQALAKEAVLGSGDFPPEWRYHPIALHGVSIDATCTGLHVDLSPLVITGQMGSSGTRAYGSNSRQDVVTEAFVFANADQARTIQTRLPPAFIRRCTGRAGTMDRHGGHIDSVSNLNLTAHGVDVRGYRVAVTFAGKTTYGDSLFLRAHRTWVTIFYESTPQPPAREEQFLATVAARIH